MKKITKYVLTAAMMLASAIGAQAQTPTDPDATIKAVEKIIEKHKENAEYFIAKEIYPKYRKDAKVLTGIARAYNQKSSVDSSYVFNYLRKALEVNPKYAPAYIVGGTELRQRKDTVAAFEWFDRAIAADPKDPEGYLAYARLLSNAKYSKRDVDGAVKKLEELANINPEANVYVEIGRLYVDATDIQSGLDYTNQAIDAYSKADVALMTPGQVEGYVRLLQGAGAAGAGVGAYNRSDSILSLALTKYPANADLNRLMLQNSVKLERYEQALNVADALFNKSDSLEIDFMDFIYYGDAYLGLKRYDDAIAIYQKCVDYEIKRSDYKSDEAYENMKRREDRQKGEAMKKIVDAYKDKGYVEEAIEEYKKYIEYRKGIGKLESFDLYTLGELYGKDLFAITNGEEKINAVRNAFDTFDEAAKLALVDENTSIFAVSRLNRMSIANEYLDKDYKEGLCISEAEEAIQLLSQREELKGYSKMCLENSVQYLCYYYYLNKKYRQCGKYWMQLGKINPEHKLYVSLNDRNTRKLMGIR